VAYFAAVLARTGDGWFVSDGDLDDIDNLDGLADYLRKLAPEEDPVLLFMEQEDTWFAVVRVDGEDDPRIFVSDAAAVSRSAYGDILLADPGDDAVGAEDGDEDDPAAYLSSEPEGDAELLEEYGISSGRLLQMCGSGLVPTDALSEIAERAGFADELESVR
jgi:putative tRNA adenosine deaminase-associated protein